MNKLQTPKGFRDFLPGTARIRQSVEQSIRNTFELYGFEPLETPTLEYASMLLGKYGTEADKLVFQFKDRADRELALRYDQTVPTARVLAQYQNELPKYFRRYQIQNVFRAEKPQKGRFREFTQCDIDIFGTCSPLSDAEIIACTYGTFKAIGFGTVVIKMNDRKVLFSTLDSFSSETIPTLSIIQTLDKMDKIGESGVIDELKEKGISEASANSIVSAIEKAEPSDNLRTIIKYATKLGVPAASLAFTPTLARGLDYYTGMIFEVNIPDYSAGSVCGGGRYDTLIEKLSGTSIPAVGMAIGFDRTVEAVEMRNKNETLNACQIVLVTVFDETSLSSSLAIANTLRSKGIATEVFPSVEKLEKQLKYADQKNIPFVIIAGPDETALGEVQIKDMKQRINENVSVNELTTFLSQKLNLKSQI